MSSSRRLAEASSSSDDPANGASYRIRACGRVSNALPLTLVARGGTGGELAARLRYGDERKTFVIDLTVAPR